MNQKIVLVIALLSPWLQTARADEDALRDRAAPSLARNALFDSLAVLPGPGDLAPAGNSTAGRPLPDQIELPVQRADTGGGGTRPRRGASETRPVAAIGPIAFGGAGVQGSSSSGNLPSLMTAGDMIGFSRDLDEGVQAITIINASQRWMAVYHIDSGGQIRLTSSRPLDADFTIQFNASSPLPEEIRRIQGK